MKKIKSTIKILKNGINQKFASEEWEEENEAKAPVENVHINSFFVHIWAGRFVGRKIEMEIKNRG